MSQKLTQGTLPSFYLLNACSLLPKVDELIGLIYTKPVDIVAVTESWLHNAIENRLLQLNGYNLFREDRITGRGGEVCAYVEKDINIPSRILNELAEPITKIFDVSLTSESVLKFGRILMLFPFRINSNLLVRKKQDLFHLHPLCKVLEDFVVSWMISDIGDKIDPRQFGCLKGTSTTYCLLDMIETWLPFLDGHGRHLRICFLDFSKAFDRIGHNVAVTKLLDLGVRRSLIP